MVKTESKTTPLKVALVGGETLLGREIQEVLRKRTDGAVITGYSSTGEDNLGEPEDETAYGDPIGLETVAMNQVIVLAGAEEGSFKVYELAKAAKDRPLIIDCTGHLEGQPEARIVVPFQEEPNTRAGWLQIVAHPAATALGLLLGRLTRHAGVRDIVAHIFEPASERGRRGASELHQQTTSLLAFKGLEKKVFDAQLSFNLLPQYGSEAPGKLSNIEQRIERHLATILSNQPKEGPALVPSLRLIQAPVFHGYSISLWVEFLNSVSATEVEEAVASAQIEVRREKDEVPNNVEAAGQSGLIVGDVRSDRNNSKAVWLWAVGDNLRLTADAASEIISGIKAAPK